MSEERKEEQIENQVLTTTATKKKEKEYNLLYPFILIFIDFKTLISFKWISKHYHQMIEDENGISLGYWPALCNSFCYEAGLYSPIIINPEMLFFSTQQYRKHFFDDLWPLRNKWTLANQQQQLQLQQQQQSYKIKVACRFRPGETPEGKVCLPLRQFLKIKRSKQQQQQQETNNTNKENQELNSSDAAFFIGEKEPEEFLDPFLGTLMKDPVLLTSSNQICDRSIALQCILRGGRDPFNNRKLTPQMLQPLPELQKRIQDWKLQSDMKKKDISVDLKDTKYLVDNQNFNPDLLDALLEMERINRTLKKAKDEMKEGHNNANAHFENPLLGGGIFEDAAVVLVDELLLENDPEVNNLEQAVMNNEQPNPNNIPFIPFNPFAPQQVPVPVEESASKKAELARVVEINSQQSFVSMHIPGSGVRPFHYSYVYNTKIKQMELYEKSVKESISSVLNGCNACIMCYGQTGSGKTFTFLGPENCLDEIDSNCFNEKTNNFYDITPNLGLVLRTVKDLFEAKDNLSKYNITMTIGLQMVEVYEEKTTDLITKRAVTVRRENGSINGPILHCSSALDVLDRIKIAHHNQHFAETAMNQRSSRAHTIFIFHITQQFSKPTDNKGDEEAPVLLQSQLHLVDLAGSERVKKSNVTGLHFREAVGINSSLLVLGKVISSLVESNKHVPYYESKLTTILKSAFGGNSRTTVIVNTRIEDIHGEETLQTLRFGERCSMISNQLKQIATSFEDTLHLIEKSLKNLDKQLLAFQQKNKTHLPTYQTLLNSYDILERKKNELILLQAERDEYKQHHQLHQAHSPQHSLNQIPSQDSSLAV